MLLSVYFQHLPKSKDRGKDILNYLKQSTRVYLVERYIYDLTATLLITSSGNMQFHGTRPPVTDTAHKQLVVYCILTHIWLLTEEVTAAISSSDGDRRPSEKTRR